ncbi:MAG: extracellular solute-binding protein [Firmicutes bacterium]|nr:extracellular solute-binding protein [Bacillota bacterium]
MVKNVKRFLILLVTCLVILIPVSAKSVYPLKTDVTLTYWMELHQNTALITTNFGDLPLAKELEKRTGIKVKYIHPPVASQAVGPTGRATEAFNLMVASGELPDIIEYFWRYIPGGPTAAIKNGIIIRLNDAIKKWAPNLRAFLRKHPEIDKMVKTDEGDYFCFPFLRGTGPGPLLSTAGLIIRKDWLDELGLPIPTTIDEWYTVLKAFKEKKGATAPLTIQMGNLREDFANAFNFFAPSMGNGFYVDRGKVKYGWIDPNMKNFYITMNKWYKEGLIDPNFATLSSKTIDANILSGKSGAAHGSGGSGIGRWLPALREKDPKADLAGCPWPAAKKGEKIAKFGYAQAIWPGEGGNAAISTKCKNVEAAVRFLDYNYSPEGHLLMNFGIEGISYKMVDGYPTYTDTIMKASAITQEMSRYMRGHTNGPFVQDPRYLEQYYALPQQKQAQAEWMKTDAVKYHLPPISLTSEESSEVAKIISEIDTYNSEMFMKFIMGTEPIENFDKYVAQVKKLGLDRVLEIYQRAYERYRRR